MIKFIKKQAKSIVAITGRHKWPVESSQLLILAYHRILPKHDPRYFYEQPTMVVTPESFEKNLNWISEHFQFISLNTWLNMCHKNEAPKGKFCAITFDDGWVDNLQYAMPILEKHHVPATIFCVSGMLDGKENYWPGLLTTLVHEANQSNNGNSFIENPAFSWLKNACIKDNINWKNLTTSDFNQIIESVKIYKDSDILNHIKKTKLNLNMTYKDEQQLLNVDELKTMVSTGLIEIGSHTVNHTRFTRTTHDDCLSLEIKDSKKQLEKTFNTKIQTFCYPNGYHPENSVRIVNQHYQGACTLEKGWNSCKTDFSKLHRVSLHETVAQNKTHFKARLSGWL